MSYLHFWKRQRFQWRQSHLGCSFVWMVKKGATPCVSPWVEIISYVSETILLFPATLQYLRKVSRVNPETATGLSCSPVIAPQLCRDNACLLLPVASSGSLQGCSPESPSRLQLFTSQQLPEASIACYSAVLSRLFLSKFFQAKYHVARCLDTCAQKHCCFQLAHCVGGERDSCSHCSF